MSGTISAADLNRMHDQLSDYSTNLPNLIQRAQTQLDAAEATGDYKDADALNAQITYLTNDYPKCKDTKIQTLDNSQEMQMVLSALAGVNAEIKEILSSTQSTTELLTSLTALATNAATIRTKLLA